MSQPVCRFLHPFGVVRHPHLQPEVKRAILASWASDHSAVRDKPALRQPPGVSRPARVDDVFAALKAPDEAEAPFCALQRGSKGRLWRRMSDASASGVPCGTDH